MTFIFDQQGAPNGRLRVMNDGTVVAAYMSQDWIYLDGISFVVAQ